MAEINTLTDYDAYAVDFDKMRMPNPIITRKLREFFDSASEILSIGCGTGQYEENLKFKIGIYGLDKSIGMLQVAKNRINNCINANMLQLPFRDGAFDGCYFMQSFHHLGANFELSVEDRIKSRKAVLKEAFRVIKKGHIVIIQRDPSQNKSVWFWKYFPKALEKKLIIQPLVKTLADWMEEAGFKNVFEAPVHDPMIKGFYDPEAPLSPSFRKSFSEFSYLSEEEMQQGVNSLKIAISKGEAADEVEKSKARFSKIGGTVFVISGLKN